ncbi:MAG TPA: bifunctional metallophosphatase/5'-nucleotidase [Firmicutes bacterium]|nr:bifunctional metallophosphatase/5'-nucleotidase [Bacillota bacterium]
MKNLKLYFTSDLHGYVYPTDYRDDTQQPMGMLNIINEYKKDGNTLIFDGGDTIQGSPFTTYLNMQDFDVHPIAQVMNAGGYDYMTLGNHEFNYGYDYLKKYINHLNGKCLCTNIVDKTGEINIGNSDIKVLENGLRVGVIGFTTDFIPIWENPKHLTNFDVLSTFPTVKAEYDLLKPQVDVLIGVYHGGFERDLDSHDVLSTSSENIAFKICEELEFDILLTGHAHLPIKDTTLFGTHIVQTQHNGAHYIELNLSMDEQGVKTITSTHKTPSVNPHPAMYEALLPLETDVQSWLDQPVGHLNMPLNPTSRVDMAMNGTPLANFINQIQFDISSADLSCTSFANSIKGFNQSVTVRDIVSTYIYPNTLVVRKVTGDILKQALEVCASYLEKEGDEVVVSNRFLQPKEAHYNYDFFAGFEYKFDLNREVGDRVVSMTRNGDEMKLDDEFTLVMNNYRSSCVGGYDCYEAAPIVKEIQIDMTEIIISYFNQYKNVTVDETKYISVIA